jgi:hypothetical protein
MSPEEHGVCMDRALLHARMDRNWSEILEHAASDPGAPGAIERMTALRVERVGLALDTVLLLDRIELLIGSDLAGVKRPFLEFLNDSTKW